jgi:acyl-CoA:acyl-CoA alkyltransferase
VKALWKKVRIESMAAVMPPIEITSDSIEERLQPVYDRLRLPAGRLELMTGIRSRRAWADNKLPSAASAEAGELLLKRTTVNPAKIGLLAHCGVCRDRLEPATAAEVHARLKLSGEVQFLDISNACLGFLNGMMLAAGLIESGQIEAALLVSGENGKPLLDRTVRCLLEEPHTRKSIKPYFANLTIGSGAVACMLTHEDLAPNAPRFIGGVVESDSSHNHLCQGDADGADLIMTTESELLLQAGLQVAGRCWKRFLQHTGWVTEAIRMTVCHQVGRAHQKQLLESLGIPEELDFVTYPETGNVGSVSLPLTLERALGSGKLQRGDKVALLGIGSGLSSIMAGVEIV